MLSSKGVSWELGGLIRGQNLRHVWNPSKRAPRLRLLKTGKSSIKPHDERVFKRWRRYRKKVKSHLTNTAKFDYQAGWSWLQDKNSSATTEKKASSRRFFGILRPASAGLPADERRKEYRGRPVWALMPPFVSTATWDRPVHSTVILDSRPGSDSNARKFHKWENISIGIHVWAKEDMLLGSYFGKQEAMGKCQLAFKRSGRCQMVPPWYRREENEKASVASCQPKWRDQSVRRGLSAVATV